MIRLVMRNSLKGQRFDTSFYSRDVLSVARNLVGQILVRQFSDGSTKRFIITEVEAYNGTDDLACHASKGKTKRTEVMFAKGGCAYIYLIYGMHWMLNVVTGEADVPQAVLVRGVEGCYGPGRLTRLLDIDKSFNGEEFSSSQRIWFESSGLKPTLKSGSRIGVGYAGEYWAKIPWRFWFE